MKRSIIAAIEAIFRPPTALKRRPGLSSNDTDRRPAG
jgi:hypothetical protein